MAYDDEVRTVPIAYLGIVCAIGTIVIVMLLQVVYFQEFNELKQAEFAADRPPSDLATLTAQQQTALTRREFVDQDQGVVTIGISRAMELVVAELAEGKSPDDVIGPTVSVASPAPTESSPSSPPNALDDQSATPPDQSNDQETARSTEPHAQETPPPREPEATETSAEQAIHGDPSQEENGENKAS